MLNMYEQNERTEQDAAESRQLTDTKKVSRRKNKSFRTMAGMMALCAVLGGGFGFAGGYLSNSLTAQAPQPAAVSQSSTASTAVVSTVSTSGSAMTVKEIAASCADSVVEIVTESMTTNSYLRQYVTEGAGSGVIISSDGYIITNNHVIEGADKIMVTTRSGESYEAVLVGTDAQTDVAVIKVEASGLKAAQYGDSNTLQVGQTAVAIGNPLGELGGTVTDGIISALSREITIDGETMTLLQTNAAINPGNSGGGLFDDQGRLVGIVNAKSSGTGIEGIGFAIPINTARSVAEELMQTGYVSGRVEMGLSLTEIGDYWTAMQAGVSRAGVYVTAVSGTAAQNAGFQRGDCITAIDGTAVSTVAEVKALLKEHSVGDTITVSVIRGNRSGDLSLTLQQLQPAGSLSTSTI